MKKTKWIAVLLVIFLTMPIQAFASATEATSLPTPGILPGNLLYHLDTLMEKIQLTFTFNPLGKADLLDKMAAERLSESQALIKKEKVDLGEEALKEYQDTLNQISKIVSKEILNGKNTMETINGIYENTQEHAAVLEDILGYLPSEQAEVIGNDLNVIEHIKNANDLFMANTKNQESNKGQSSMKLDEETIQALLSIGENNGHSLDEVLQNGTYDKETMNAFYSLSENSGETIEDVITAFLRNNPQYSEMAKNLGIDPNETFKYINMDRNEMLDWVNNFIQNVDMDGMANQVMNFLDSVEPPEE